MGHRTSMCIDYEQLGEVCSTAGRSFPISRVDLVGMVSRSVLVLSEFLIVDKCADEPKKILKTSNEIIMALQSQLGLMEVEIGSEVAPADSIDGA